MPLKCLGADCGEAIGDWWAAVLNAIEGDRPYKTVEAMGYRRKAFTLPTSLKARKQITVDLREHGIPEGARILEINYLSLDGFPVDVGDSKNFWALREKTSEATRSADGSYAVPLVNATSVRRRSLPHSYSLYGAEYGKRSDEETRLQVAVEWLEPDTVHEVPLNALIDSFEAFEVKRYNAALLQANVAVELKTENLLMGCRTEMNQRFPGSAL